MSIFDDVTENDFLSQLNSWLGHNPNEACSKGGHAAYGSAVYQIDNDCQEWLTKVSRSFSHQNQRSFIISVGYQDVTNTEIQSPTSTYRHQHHDVTNIIHFCRVYFFGSFNFIIAIRFRLGPYFQLLNLEEDFDKVSEVHNLENFPI